MCSRTEKGTTKEDNVELRRKERAKKIKEVYGGNSRKKGKNRGDIFSGLRSLNEGSSYCQKDNKSICSQINEGADTGWFAIVELAERVGEKETVEAVARVAGHALVDLE